MPEPHENPPPPRSPDNLSSEFGQILTQIQRMSAEQVVDELNSVQTETANGAKDGAKDIKNTFDENKNALIMQPDKLPDAILKNQLVMSRLNNITDIVKRTVVAISTGQAEGDIFAGVPERSKNILTSLCNKLTVGGRIDRVDNASAIFINEIIIRGLNGGLETTSDLIDVFRSIKSSFYTDYYLYEQVADLLRSQAQELSASKQDLEQLMTEEQRKDKSTIITKEEEERRKQIVEELNKNIVSSRQRIGAIIDILGPDDIRRSEIGEKIKNKNIPEAEKDRLINDELIRLRTQFLVSLNNLNSSAGSSLDIRQMEENGASPEDVARAVIEANTLNSQITGANLTNNFAQFNRTLDQLGGMGGLGVLSARDYQSLRGETALLENNSKQLMSLHERILNENQGKGRFFAMVSTYITTWSVPDKKLLAVFDNKDAFIELIKRPFNTDIPSESGYNGFKTLKDWERFNHDFKHIFDTIFAGTASNPKDFFQSTYSELKEGMVYKELTTALLKLGNDLKDDAEYGALSPKKFVGIKDIYAKYEKQAFDRSRMTGGPTLSTEKIIQDCLGKGIRALTYEMIDYKELTQHSHDVNALVESGLGFDKLNEFSARLRQEDVDRLVKGMPGLADAIQLYHTNLAHETSRAGRMISVEMGRRMISFHNLDSTGRLTFSQLVGLEDIQERGLTDEDVARMVSFASGLAKGVYGGYYGQIGNNHIGAELKERDRDLSNPDDLRPFWEIEIEAKSTSDRGAEKMWASLDPDQVFVKFGRPREYQAIRYAFSPRKIRDFNPSAKDYWRNHGKIYEYAEMGERAVANGACNEYLDMNRKYKFLKESMKTLIVDLGERSGWRHYDYRQRLEYLPLDPDNPNDRTRKVDFHKTITRLQGVGEEAIRVFINDLFRGKSDYQADTSGLSIEDVGHDIIVENEDYLKCFAKPGWTSSQKLNNEQLGKMKELFYDKYIFQQIRKTHPSLFIAMETREVIPEDEVRGTRRSKREIEIIKTEKERRCEEKRRRGEEIIPEDKFGPEDTYEKGFTFQDQLTDYLFDLYKDSGNSKEWIKTHLLPMYTSALQVTEKNEWKVHYKIWEQNEKNGVYDPSHDPFNYEFTEAAFNIHEKSLQTFFRRYRQDIGITKEGKMVESLNDEQFIEHLKGFYNRMEYVIKKDRWDHNTVQDKLGNWNHTGHQETLTQRYAGLLAADMAGVGSYISWNCLNLDKFAFSTSGNRLGERIFSEAALHVSKGAPSINAILMDKMPAFARKIVKDDTEFEQSVEHFFGEDFKNINISIANIDDDIAWDYIGNFTMAMVTAMRDDRIFAIGGIGGLLKGLLRRTDNIQSSFITDAIPEDEREGATSLDTTIRQDIFLRKIGNLVKMQRKKNQIVGHGPSKFFGLIPGKNIYNKKPSLSIEQLVNEAQAGIKYRLVENIPMLGPILAIIIAMLAKLAFDKDNKK